MLRVQILVPIYNYVTPFGLSNPHFPDLGSLVNTPLAGSLYVLEEMNYIVQHLVGAQ